MNSNFKAIFSTIYMHMKLSISRTMFRFVIFVQPILYGFLLYMIFKGNNLNIISYTILGSGILTMWSSIIFSSAGDIERERRMGTLESINCTPVPFHLIIIGKVIANTIWGLLSILITVLSISLFFHVKIIIVHPSLFLISVIPTIVSFISIGLILSEFFTLSRNSYGLMNALEYPIYILCGFIVPLDLLPKWLLPISYLFAPTWAVKILRESVVGIKSMTYFKSEFLILIVSVIIYFILFVQLLKVIDKKTRINASLGGY